MDNDIKYMNLALAEARAAMAADEIPVGAVIVGADGSILAKAHNLTEALADATAHAEMQAITAASASIGGKYLPDCTLYVTVEPCLMCAGAIGWCQLGRIVYGCSDPNRGFSVFTTRAFHPKADITSGVMEVECAALMTEFFKRKR